MYEFFEHTADLGFRIRAKTLPELFAEAGRALLATLVENHEAVRPNDRRTFEVRAARYDELLYDWLAELLYAYDAEHWLAAQFEVSLAVGRLSAVARGEAIDPDRHRLDSQVKAITYHGLRVEQTDDGWLAEVIVDV